jgi:hypothetical protein
MGILLILKIRLQDLERGRDYIDGPGFQSMGPVSRLQVGESYGSFYGYTYSGNFSESGTN